VSDGGSQGDDIEERARRHNSTLQSLIDAIGTVLAASRELLARLQGYPKQDEAPGRGAAPDADQAPDPPDEPPDANQLRWAPPRQRRTSSSPSLDLWAECGRAEMPADAIT
jgi:hypothetical protein